jgi:hypothetical protein
VVVALSKITLDTTVLERLSSRPAARSLKLIVLSHAPLNRPLGLGACLGGAALAHSVAPLHLPPFFRFVVLVNDTSMIPSRPAT